MPGTMVSIRPLWESHEGRFIITLKSVREREREIHFPIFKEVHFQIFFFANHLTYDASIQHGYGKSQQKKKMMMTKK